MSDKSNETSAVSQVVTRIHEMLASMELSPGQQIRQESLALRLGVSRAPVREALRIAQSEGFLQHERNVGYTVKRLTLSELNQYYLMRRALEGEILMALPPLSDARIAKLVKINQKIEAAAGGSDVTLIRDLNHEFHFLIFTAAKMDLVVREVERLWSLTEAYRVHYLFDGAARLRIVQEHERIIAALRTSDRAQLVKEMNDHRAGVPTQLGPLIGVRPAD